MKLNFFKIISNLFYLLVLLVVILMAGSLVLDRFNTPIKYKLYSVQSGSMEPTLRTGSLIIVAPFESYQIGDVINFHSEKNIKDTVTHRIYGLVNDELDSVTKIQTKGDANEDPDAEAILPNRINGRVIFHIPYLGYAVAFSQTQIGFISLIIIPATLIVYSEIMNLKKEASNLIAQAKAKKAEKAHDQNIVSEVDAGITIAKAKKPASSKKPEKISKKEKPDDPKVEQVKNKDKTIKAKSKSSTQATKTKTKAKTKSKAKRNSRNSKSKKSKKAKSKHKK